MFIEQGINTGNKFWKYILGSIFVIGASFLGQMPMLVLMLFETALKGKKYPTTDAELLHFFEPNLNLFLLLIPFVFALGGIYFAVRFLHRQKFISIITSREKMDWKRVFFSFGIWSVFTIISTLLMCYVSPDDFKFNFQLVPFSILVVIASLLVPIQTSVEELVFRGYLMQGFANLFKNKWFPLLMTSCVFGLMHFSNPEVAKMGNIIMIYYIGTGLLLGIMTLMDEGMELALGFHAANNLIGALLVTSDWSAFQTYSIFKDVSEPVAGLDIILPVIVVYPLLLTIFGMKYKWSGWRDKLTGAVV
ncbi:CPBP family intramembrane glutamic endopeptidase [Flavobacterium gilvum]|uniref:Abortive phage infection protein n=1 Tax=Flavobacterium gilvum TaxID=1492737 RepID=A0AAC9N763_9FLAO|nr:CPBP family intramembrane glutamic endopeptidase [Flavobacterium gilvum]AOW10514.1 abortive phage infection protein [Flavobacterium gilvum]KFC59989.1 abortive phage infection protein [Flavobacterium gilvum]